MSNLTRIITIQIKGDNPVVLDQYAEKLADLADEAMVGQEENNSIPNGVEYEGVEVIDPDAPEAEEPEVIKPT